MWFNKLMMMMKLMMMAVQRKRLRNLAPKIAAVIFIQILITWNSRENSLYEVLRLSETCSALTPVCQKSIRFPNNPSCVVLSDKQLAVRPGFGQYLNTASTAGKPITWLASVGARYSSLYMILALVKTTRILAARSVMDELITR